MTAAFLLDRLDGVKRLGVNRWLARCPAHSDKHASLAVRELDDGTILLHDFAGCSTGDVLAAIRLTFNDLFPNKGTANDHRRRGERRPFPAADVLCAIEQEALVTATAASFLGNGGTLTFEDRERLLLAAQRIALAVRESRHA